MNKNSQSLVVVTVAVALLTACHNPADDVPAAETSDATKLQETDSGSTSPSSQTAKLKVFTIHPESKIGFIGSKVTGSHEGGFKAFTGTFTVSEGKLAGTQTVVIDTKSLWADSDRLAGHLKSPDFFDVEKHPTATFTAVSIEPEGDGHKVIGNLDLHGVTKQIAFPAQIVISDDQISVKAEFSIKRFDFDIKYPGKTDDLIRDEVVIKLNVVAREGNASTGA